MSNCKQGQIKIGGRCQKVDNITIKMQIEDKSEINKELLADWIQRAWWCKGRTTLETLIKEIWQNGYNSKKEE